MSAQDNLFSQILTTAVKSGELLAIYNQLDNIDTFWVGKVIRFDQVAGNVLLEAYDEFGLRSGWRILRFEQIWQINRQDNYVNDLQEGITLINRGTLTGLIDMPKVDLDSLLALPSLALAKILQLCKKERWFTGITLNFSSDPEIYGYIQAVADESLVVATYSLAGKLEGEQTFYLHDVQSLVWQNYQSLVREKLALARE